MKVQNFIRGLMIALTFTALSVPLLQAQAPQGRGGGRGRGPKVADAKPGDFRIIASNGLRVPLEAVKEEAEKVVGHPFVIEYGASLGLKNEMEAGQAFEVTILTPEVLDDLIAKGKVIPGSRYDVARVPVAIGQRGDAPKQDISTPAALKKAMLGAKSLRWASNGASLPTIHNVLDKLGIEAQVKDKVNMPGKVELGPGEYEFNINLASEIIGAPGQVYIGNIPAELNIPAVMSIGIGTQGDAKEAEKLIKFLHGPAIEASLKANGMTR